MTKISPARAAPQAHPQYTLAKRLDLKRYSTVVIWCRGLRRGVHERAAVGVLSRLGHALVLSLRVLA